MFLFLSHFQAIKRARDLHNMSAAPPSVLPEYKLWEEHWCRCSHELGQWDTLNEFGKAHNGAKPFLGEGGRWSVNFTNFILGADISSVFKVYEICIGRVCFNWEELNAT